MFMPRWYALDNWARQATNDVGNRTNRRAGKMEETGILIRFNGLNGFNGPFSQDVHQAIRDLEAWVVTSAS